MKRIEEIIDLIEITGDKCVILHKERGAYVVMKMDDYKGLVIEKFQKNVEVKEIIQKNNQSDSFFRSASLINHYNTDIRQFEIPEEDRFYNEPLED